MKYIIMCGGDYKDFKTPKHLSVINGERIVDRTIRLLKKHGVKDIYISSNNKAFDNCGVPRIEHDNNFTLEKDKCTGYWLDAFYPVQEEVCYIFGDVYFTDNAIKTIVEYDSKLDTLFGTGIAKNKFHENWGEPFAYKVKNYKEFLKGIEEVKKLFDEGKIKRHPIVWELYRYLNGLDINIQKVLDKNYICIDDGTIDIDTPERINELEGLHE